MGCVACATRRSALAGLAVLCGVISLLVARTAGAEWVVGAPAIREIPVGVDHGATLREARAGKMPDGYLVTVVWSDSLQLVRLLCVHPQAGGCHRSEPQGPTASHPAYRREVIVIYGRERVSDTTLAVLAHEICHAVADAQRLPDPCHEP